MSDRSPAPDQQPHTSPSRRALLAGAGAIGVGAIAVATSSGALLPSAAPAPAPVPEVDDDGSVGEATVVAVVAAGSPDTVTVMSGDRQVVITDRALVRSLTSKAR